MLGLLVNVVAAALLAFTIFFYVADLYDVAQALDAAEHRHRRRRGRLAADDRLGGGDRCASASSRCCCSSSSSSGRRRISGRCRSTAPRITRAPASDAAGRRRRRLNEVADPLYTLILVPLGIAPWTLGYAGLLYGRWAASGAVMLALALRCARRATRFARQQASFRLLDPLSVPGVCRAAGRPMSPVLFGHLAA